MKELQGIVNEKIAAMVADGTVEKAIQERVENTIKECIKDAFRTYGDFGKVIKDKIETSLQTAGRDVSIPAYNQFIKQVVEDKFISILNDNAVSHLSDLVGEIVEPVQRDGKMSTLIHKISELWGDCARESGHEEIRIEAERNDDDTALYVKIYHPNYSGDNVKVTFYNFKSDDDDRWHIGYINEDDKMVSGRASNVAKTHLNEVTSLFFKYYAMGTKFEMDEEFESIYVYD